MNLDEDRFLTELLQAVDQQLAAPETAFVREIYEQLISEHGRSDEEAREIIAHCLAEETEAMLREQRDFDLAAYKNALEDQIN